MYSSHYSGFGRDLLKFVVSLYFSMKFRLKLGKKYLIKHKEECIMHGAIISFYIILSLTL